MNDNIFKNLLIYIISFCSGIFIITYLLKVPHLITGNNEIVNQYYLSNFMKNLPLDFLFVLLYFLFAHIFIRLNNIKKNSTKILIIVICTVILTGGFCYYFTTRKQTTNFFSKWFHTVGYSSILYDVILLVAIYIIYLYLDKLITSN